MRIVREELNWEYYKFLKKLGKHVKNSYKILSKEQLIVEKYQGTFSLLSFITLKRKEVCDKDYNNTYDYIIDFSQVYFPDYQKYQDIVYFIELYIDKIHLSKCAIITQNPNQVVESVLFSLEAEKILPVSFKVFSEYSSAYKWLKNGVTSHSSESSHISNN